MQSLFSHVFVFDLDDTLYEEKDFVISGFKAVVSWLHNKFDLSTKARNEINVNLLYKYYQENSTKVFNQLSDQWGPFPVNELINIYRNHVPEISLAEDAEEILLYLKGEVPLAIITDGFKKQQSNKIKALGLDKFFSLKNIIINEAPQLLKPSEKCFLQVEAMFPDKKYIYIGDNINKDFITPNKLGWDTFCIRRESGIHKSNEKLNEEYYAKKIINLLTEIKFISED